MKRKKLLLVKSVHSSKFGVPLFITEESKQSISPCVSCESSNFNEIGCADSYFDSWRRTCCWKITLEIQYSERMLYWKLFLEHNLVLDGLIKEKIAARKQTHDW